MSGVLQRRDGRVARRRGFRGVAGGTPEAVSDTVISPESREMPRRESVPVRTIATVIAMVLATVLVLLLLRAMSKILVWVVIAAFFAVALHPVANRIQRRVGGRRWLATLLLFLVAVVLLVGITAAFITPLVRQAGVLIDRAPAYLDQVRSGKGALGELAQRVNLNDVLARNSSKLKANASTLGAPALGVLRGAATSAAAIITIVVLAYLMVLEGPQVVAGSLGLLSEQRQRRVRKVSADCARTVTGYLSGNLLISVICGALTYLTLLLLGVPYAGLISLFVAVADLIPLVGATLGAVVAVIAAFVHDTTAGIVVVVVFIVYQQLENHLLQPVIFARTVQLNPLAVLLAILAGVELAGILGALLAIPVAGVIQVIVRDLYDNRKGQLTPAPTVGPAEQLV